jgi:hypothetical protein
VLSGLLILIFNLFPVAVYAGEPGAVDWKELIVAPKESIVSEDAGTQVRRDILPEEPPTRVTLPSFSAGIVSGFVVPQPISKFKMDFSAGMYLQWIKGLNIEVMGVFPAMLHISAGWFFRLNDDRDCVANTAFYAGLSVLERASDILPGLIDPRKYAPTVGIRFTKRMDKKFSGLLLDNRYSFDLSDGGAVRMVFVLGYFFAM